MRQKKILIVGTDANAVHDFSQDFEIELVSSVSFIDSVLFTFMPDIIVLDSMYEADVGMIRSNSRLSKTPVLLAAENVSYLSDFSAVTAIPGILLCNRALLSNRDFQEQLKKIAEHRASPLPPGTGALVKKAILAINKSYSGPLTRESLAQSLGTSPDYLSRIFKKEMGMHLWDYVNAYRLSEARNMLLETGRPVSEVSSLSGFSDPAYFTRLFRRTYGSSPTAFRSR